jgi:hypothetical protein
MNTSSPLATIFGPIYSTGSGAGMGLLISFASLGAAIVGFSGFFIHAVLDAEEILPDFDTLISDQSEKQLLGQRPYR